MSFIYKTFNSREKTFCYYNLIIYTKNYVTDLLQKYTVYFYLLTMMKNRIMD